MKMICFDDLQLFVCIVVLGSFLQVVCEVDLLLGQVVVVVVWLECELDLCLFVCIMCSLCLIGEGVLYLLYVQEVLVILCEGQVCVQGEDVELYGILQLLVLLDFGCNLLLFWLSVFCVVYLWLCLYLCLFDEVVDVFCDLVDVVICIGYFDDVNYVVLFLLEGNWCVFVVLFDYLQWCGMFICLDELCEYDCLVYQFGGCVYDCWLFEVDGCCSVILVCGLLVCDDVDVVWCWVVVGEGIIYKFWLDLCEDVFVGCLQLLFDGIGSYILLQLVCLYCKQFLFVVWQLYVQLCQYL